MAQDAIRRLIRRIDGEHLKAALYHLSKDPLPYRKLNHTVPGHATNTLYEADDYLQRRLESWGYAVAKEGVQVQCFGRDESKPKAHQYAPSPPGAPWYTAYNLYAKKKGTTKPDEIILFLAHKDSQSWVDSPGAYDNAAGTAAVLEIAHTLGDYPSQRSIRFLFCNEEHRPWTSKAAAEEARARGDDLIAIFNLDALGGKSQEDYDARRRTNVTLYTEPEAERLAEVTAEVNEACGIGLIQTKKRKERPGSDDGSFVQAGYPMAIMNIGSAPYADPNYHTEGDIPELVDIENVRMAAQVTLGVALRVDRGEM